MADPSPVDRSQPARPLPRGEPDRFGASLPIPLTGFVGRTREIAQLVALLRGETRLVTLTGPGGVGKTRLAVRLATELAPEFADGVAFVGLASVADHLLVLPTVARASSRQPSGRTGALMPGTAIARRCARRRG